MKVWFDDPQQLVRTDKISQFWPTSEQTPEDRINAASRFVIYASCLIYIIRRDPRISFWARQYYPLYLFFIGQKWSPKHMEVQLKVRYAKCPPKTIPWVMYSWLITRMLPIGWSRVIIPLWSLSWIATRVTKFQWMAGVPDPPSPSICEMLWIANSSPHPYLKSQGIRLHLPNGYMELRTVQCVKRIPSIVIPTREVSNSKPFRVLVPMGISGRECLGVAYS